MQKNRSTWGVGVVLGLAVLLGGISAAEAITIRSAAVQFGVAVVEGQASPNADIFWEGNPVTQANSKNGGFKVVGVVPADCVGTLVDGTTGDIEDVALDDCDPDGSGGSGAPAPVERTGQTEPFAEGDDGDIQAGVPFPSPRFTDNGDGTVMDHLTGLIWLKDANCLGSERWANALIAALHLAVPFCGLSDGSVAGDWRLPNVKELQSLLHFGFVNPALSNAEGTAQWMQGDAFVNVPTNPPRIYYSSTTSRNDDTSAWLVDLADGRTFTAGKQFINRVWPVRPVRGGAEPRFVDQGDGTVTDALTGLIWLKDASCLGSQTWANALNAANNLAAPHCGLSDGSVAGDWRLPNVKELQSLLNFRFEDPALSNAEGTAQWTQGDAFVNVPTFPSTTRYWSSTTIANNTGNAWIVGLIFGDTLTNGKGSASLVWPVRGGAE